MNISFGMTPVTMQEVINQGSSYNLANILNRLKGRDIPSCIGDSVDLVTYG